MDSSLLNAYRKRTFSERLPHSLYLALASGSHSSPAIDTLNDDFGDEFEIGISRNIFDNPGFPYIDQYVPIWDVPDDRAYSDFMKSE